LKTLFDTNVVLDLLLDREPYSSQAAYLLSKVERSEIIGFLCATTITTIHYLATKALDKHQAIKHIKSLLSLFEIAPVNRLILENALNPGFTVFEDSVIHQSACHVGAEYIITRNVTDFKTSNIPVYTPIEFINMLESLEK